jgi:hypothetical protein
MQLGIHDISEGMTPTFVPCLKAFFHHHITSQYIKDFMSYLRFILINIVDIPGGERNARG